MDDKKNETNVHPDGAVWNAELIQRVATLGVIMVATLVGNLMIVLVLSRSRYRKRSSRVNIFILNLAIGDLAVCCITMTSEMLFEVESGVTTSGRVRYECTSKGYTSMWQRKLYFTWLTAYILIIPSTCISYCYVNVLRCVWLAGREQDNNTSAIYLRRSVSASSMFPRAKIKTLKLTICIIASFVICWTPYFIVHNIRIYSNYTINVPKPIIIGAETLALLNSALNPIFYGYFNVRVRKGFIEIVYRKKDFSSCVAINQSGSNPVDSETAYSNSYVQNQNGTRNKTMVVTSDAHVNSPNSLRRHRERSHRQQKKNSYDSTRVFGGWILGSVACKVIVYGQIVTLASSTFILASMSYDRYQAICRPLRSQGGVTQAKRMIMASWVLAGILAIPQLFIFVQ
ncbi:vasopressin V1a receptor-like, partial [Limulus polyphemus]|uniref:Vasopressin V1a receptor-like n=1 Tax=Limulus polyphemus TaxID=6850 RepID=A0ABM1BJW2_LIMPO